MAQLGFPLFDADNHYYEPRDAFTRHLEPSHRDRAIHVETDDRGRDRVMIGGRPFTFLENPFFETTAKPGSLREMLRMLLRRAGYTVTLTASRAEAEAMLDEPERFDAVITDLALPDGSGMDVLSKAREMDDSLQLLMITAYDSKEKYDTAMRYGADGFMTKPVDFAALRQHIFDAESD